MAWVRTSEAWSTSLVDSGEVLLFGRARYLHSQLPSKGYCRNGIMRWFRLLGLLCFMGGMLTSFFSRYQLFHCDESACDCGSHLEMMSEENWRS